MEIIKLFRYFAVVSRMLIKLFCFKAKPSSRQEAYKDCLGIKGRLSFYSSFTKTAGSINHKYYTSYFRSFRLFDNGTTCDNTVCIAATKVNDIIYFEPDDCSVEKYFLCQYNDLKVLTPVSQDSRIQTDSSMGYVSLAFSVVAMAVTTLVIILLYKLKKWITLAVLPRITSRQRADSVVQNPIQRNDKNNSLVSSSYHYAAPDCETRSLGTQRKQPTEQSGSQLPLAESSFVEEGLYTVKLHHVYEGLSDDRQQATYEVISQSKNRKQ